MRCWHAEAAGCQHPAALPSLLPAPQRTRGSIPPTQALWQRGPHPAQGFKGIPQHRHHFGNGRARTGPKHTGGKQQLAATAARHLKLGGKQPQKATKKQKRFQCQALPETPVPFSQTFRPWEQLWECLHVLLLPAVPRRKWCEPDANHTQFWKSKPAPLIRANVIQ